MSSPFDPPPEHPESPVSAEVVASPATPPEFIQPARLSILHLLLWTAATAVLLKVNLALKALEQGESTITTDVASQAIQGAYSATLAAGIVALGVLIAAWKRGVAGRFHPGHWILLIKVPVMLAGMVLWITLWLGAIQLEARTSPNFFALILGVHGLLSGMAACLCFIAARRTIGQPRWKWYFALLTMGNLFGAAAYGWSAVEWALDAFPRYAIFGTATNLGSVFALLLLLVVLVRDLFVTSRDWVHWTGVTTAGLTYLLSLTHWLVFILAQR